MYEGKKESKFDCVQRGHAHFLEWWPAFLICLAAGGVYLPTVTAACGMLYLVGRVMYMQGYATGDPKARSRGFPIMYPPLLVMIGTSFYTVLKIATIV